MFNKKIVIATHSLVYGAPQALRDYLIRYTKVSFLYISHPLFIDHTRSYYEIIEKGKIKKKSTSGIRLRITLINYFLEFILTLKWMIMTKNTYDVFIGVDALNAFAGIVLKKLGKTKRVIFYTIDYVPVKFTNKLLNTIYHWFDYYCLKNSDEIWNVSPRITKGREKLKGLKRNVYINQKVVPIGIWYEKVKRVSFDRVKKHQLLFLGHLMESAGVQLVLRLIPTIIKKIPDFHFLVVGGGEYEMSLRTLTKALKIEKHVTFTGWIKERKVLDKIMADSALAVAIYDKKTSRNTYYADPTKLKDYLSAGLPIVLTNLPHNAKEIVKMKCGIIVDYDKRQVTKAIISLMDDEQKLNTYRQNALSYIKNFDWKVIFDKNFLPLLQ